MALPARRYAALGFIVFASGMLVLLFFVIKAATPNKRRGIRCAARNVQRGTWACDVGHRRRAALRY
jgi:hypothetical protein